MHSTFSTKNVVTTTGAFANALRTLWSACKHRLRFRPLGFGQDDVHVAALLGSLQRDGFAVLPRYYSTEQCARLRMEIDHLISVQPAAVHTNSHGADARIFGAERVSGLIAEFHNDPFLLVVAESYAGRKLTNLLTLAARLSFVPGNLGSGEGWHRDAFHFQFKSLVYLTDVEPTSGPFQLLQASHRPWRVFTDTVRGRLQRWPYSRITEDQARRICDADPERLRTFSAPAGTLVLFDSSTIHRGAPIQAGTRYALTNYFYFPEQITAELEAKFAPYPGLERK